MSESSWAALIGVATYVALRLVDYAMPKGRHWKWIERFTKPDSPAKPEDEKG